MRHIQGKRIIGYAFVLIKGNDIQNLLKELGKRHIPLWDFKMIKADEYECKLYSHDLHVLYEINNDLDEKYDISLIKERGLSSFIKHTWYKKHLLIAMILSIMAL